jgi:hypothetical protein
MGRCLEILTLAITLGCELYVSGVKLEIKSQAPSPLGHPFLSRSIPGMKKTKFEIQ